MAIDIGDQVQRIRDPRVRKHFLDAERAYRSGAYRSAIMSIWVCVTIDIIFKYEELETRGDKEAAAFLGSWRKAVESGDIKRLLDIERDILNHAADKMKIIDEFQKKRFVRLQEDRHTAAHPAFSTAGELFEPTSHEVRGHIENAVDSLLSQRPIQGRQIFEEFSIDIQSPGFPSREDEVFDYIEQKYTRRMREKTIINFIVVLAKSALRDVPPEWGNFYERVLSVLRATKMRVSPQWSEAKVDILKIINDDKPEQRERALAFVGEFPEFYDTLDHPTRIALKEHITSTSILSFRFRMLKATRINDLQDRFKEAFSGVSSVKTSEILDEYPEIIFWENCLERLRSSNSFRCAEMRFMNHIMPFSKLLSQNMLDDLLSVISENRQVYDASSIPSLLVKLIEQEEHSPSIAAVEKFHNDLPEKVRIDFEELWEIVDGFVWERPEESEPNGDGDVPF